MDEAVLRILLQDAATGGSSSYSAALPPQVQAPHAGPPQVPPAVPPPVAGSGPVAAAAGGQQPAAPPGGPPPALTQQGGGPFDPVAEARKRIEGLQRGAEIQLEFNKLYSKLPTPHTVSGTMDKEAADFATEMQKLRVSMDPQVVAQRAQQEIVLMEVRQRASAALEAELERLAPTVTPVIEAIRVLDEEAKEFSLEMGRLQASMDPELVRERVRQELELQASRQKQKRAMEEERERQAPMVEAVTPTDPEHDQFRAIFTQFRGVLGGTTGPLIGSLLDMMAMGNRRNEVKDNTVLGAAKDAAPMVAAAVAAAQAIKQIREDMVRDVKSGVTASFAIPNWAASADADPSRTLQGFGEATSKAGEKVAEYNIYLGEAMVAVGETTKALGGLTKALDSTADRYGQYSASIAQQQALAEIRQTMGDLRRSREVGPEMARYVQMQSELTQKFEDIKIKLLVQMLPYVVNILKKVEYVADLTEESVDIAKIVAKNGPHLLTSVEEIKKYLEDRDKMDKVEIGDPTDILFRDPAQGGVKLPGF